MLGSQYELDIITTRKIRKLKMTSEQSIKDRKETEDRMKCIGIKVDLVGAMLENIYGKKCTVEEIRRVAKRIAHKIDRKIDRLAHRNKYALLCWFAENWKAIYPLINITGARQFRFPQLENGIEEDLHQSQYVDPSDLKQLLNYH